MCNVKFERIILYYSEWQNGYKKLGDIEFKEGLPQSTDYASDPRCKLIIIDDLMTESSSGNAIANMFTKGSHHNNLSVIFITQNIFHQSRNARDISLNAHYLIIFRNPRDKTQVSHLSRQLCPDNPKFVQEVYFDATSKPYGYLLLDLKQDTPDNCRFRTSIFTDDPSLYVYVPKKGIKGADGVNNVPVLPM